MSKEKPIGNCGAFLFAVLLAFFPLAGQHQASETAGNADDAWRLELSKEREQKDIEFKTSTTSPMAGSARLTISAKEKTYVAIRANTVSLQPQAGADTVFSVSARDGRWFWHRATGSVSCSQDGRAIAPDADPLTPGSRFSVDRFTLAVYPGPDILALIVFDPQRPQRLAFKHLLYFPPDRAYAVKARLEKFPEQREIKIITTRKLEKTFYRYGRVHFTIAGQTLALTALKTSLEGAAAAELFIPFKDDSNGRETYEVGRFLDVAEPAGEDFILDFNRCYNPLCNYSPAYNCPLPPLENMLDIAVLAGEKTYPH